MTNKEKLDEAVKKAKEKNNKELDFMKTNLGEKLKSITQYLDEIADLVQGIGYSIKYYAKSNDISMILIIKEKAIIFENEEGDGFRYIPHDGFWFCSKETKSILSLRKQYEIACDAEYILKERHAFIIEYIIQSAVKKEMKKDIDGDSYYKINE